jgi:hypothetical protein
MFLRLVEEPARHLPPRILRSVCSDVKEVERKSVVARETFRAADVEYSRERLELLLFFAAIQKLWATVNSQAWIVNHSLGLLEQTQGAGDGTNAPTIGLQLGRSTYTRASPEYGKLVSLRLGLNQLLKQLEVRSVIEQSSLSQMLKKLERRGLLD